MGAKSFSEKMFSPVFIQGCKAEAKYRSVPISRCCLLPERRQNEPDQGWLVWHPYRRPTFQRVLLLLCREFRSDGASYEDIIVPNQTTYVNITLNRQVDKNMFRFDPADQPRKKFGNLKPAGTPVD